MWRPEPDTVQPNSSPIVPRGAIMIRRRIIPAILPLVIAFALASLSVAQPTPAGKPDAPSLASNVEPFSDRLGNLEQRVDVILRFYELDQVPPGIADKDQIELMTTAEQLASMQRRMEWFEIRQSKRVVDRLAVLDERLQIIADRLRLDPVSRDGEMVSVVKSTASEQELAQMEVRYSHIIRHIEDSDRRHDGLLADLARLKRHIVDRPTRAPEPPDDDTKTSEPIPSPTRTKGKCVLVNWTSQHQYVNVNGLVHTVPPAIFVANGGWDYTVYPSEHVVIVPFGDVIAHNASGEYPKRWGRQHWRWTGVEHEMRINVRHTH